MPEKVIIADYDPDWPIQFEELKPVFQRALGSLAVAIEHVGSTSVPGLAAKPIIDIDIIVAHETDKPQGIDRLAAIGFEHGGDLGIAGREAFDPPPGMVPHHPYLLAAESREFRRHIAFRDRLRRDERARQDYEVLKRNLAARADVDRSNYAEHKSEFIERVLAEELGAGSR